MFDESIKKYKKAFVFGAGGGNDIVSAVLPALHLQKHGIQADVGGVMSPAAIHTYNGQLEQIINEIKGEVKRYRPAKKPLQLSFIDNYLPRFSMEEGAPINAFYNFSIRRGTKALVESFNRFIHDNQYDLIVGVDVGGDILARGAQDNTLLSPVMDFASLYLLNQLATDSYVLEFGLGTDGELRPQGMHDIMTELKSHGLILHESRIRAEDDEVRAFARIYDKIKEIRSGNTAVMTLRTLNTPTPEQDIIAAYKFRNQLGNKKWFNHFEITLPHQYFGKTYLIDAKGLAQRRKQTAIPYENPLEQYIKLKKQTSDWKTELDLHYLWSEENWTTTKPEGYCLLLLVPSKLMPERMRGEILQEGVNQLREDFGDVALILKEDLQYLRNCELNQQDADRFSLISTRKDIVGSMEKAAKQIIHYQGN